MAIGPVPAVPTAPDSKPKGIPDIMRGIGNMLRIAILEYNYKDGIPTEKYFPINFAEEDIENIEDDSNPEKYNLTTVIYTGIVGKEFALLNVLDSKIELYNKKTGNKSGELVFPEEGTPILESMFNFSYTNGIYWLFSIDERKWVGFK
jgi:hypothetical protein